MIAGMVLFYSGGSLVSGMKKSSGMQHSEAMKNPIEVQRVASTHLWNIPSLQKFKS